MQWQNVYRVVGALWRGLLPLVGPSLGGLIAALLGAAGLLPFVAGLVCSKS